MWAIVGLGNPGARYSRTRHNVGFMVIDELSARQKIEFKEKTLYLIGKGAIEGLDAVLVKPLTFMNRSGSAVREILSKSNIPIENVIVVHDDLDMETGKLKIRRGGSSGGHNGVESVIESIGTRDFIRVKIGIGKDPFIEGKDYVLGKFRPEEKEIISEAVKAASEAVGLIMREGVARAMNAYNRKPAPEKE